MSEIAEKEHTRKCINYYIDGSTDSLEDVTDKVCARIVIQDLGHSAKSVTKNSTEFTQYFIKRSGGEFYDPFNLSFTYRKMPWKLRRVSKLAFDLYLHFLGIPNKTTKGIVSYKTKAERES